MAIVVNGDEVKDLVIGAPRSFAQKGGAYVMFGKTGAFASNVLLSQLNGANGFAFEDSIGGHVAGFSVSSAGDINGDQLDEVIIGNDQASPVGVSYVIYGSNQSFSSGIESSGLPEEIGFSTTGTGAQGYSVGSAGDFNKDGVDDLLIDAPDANNNSKTNAGSVYVIYGKKILNFADGFE